MSASCLVDRYEVLEKASPCRAAFLARCPGIDVLTDRETALERLRKDHDRLREDLGFEGMPFATASQVHGNGIAIVDALTANRMFPDVDGLITNQPNICLGIYVADCAAVFIADSKGRAIGLLHSGKKGTELGITSKAIALLREKYGCAPEDLIVEISPCIRPPHYEIDFARDIARQAKEAGVGGVRDAGTCTASDPGRYYSYRREKGQTGRMLALLALLPRAKEI